MDIIREQITIEQPKALFPTVYFGGMNWAVLDIETLGLSPGRAPAILCGIVTQGAEASSEALNAPQTAQVTQFLTESIAGTEDEETMLTALEEALADIDILVTYNGRQFDLPYLAVRREKTHLAPMRRRYDLDLLPIVRHCTDIGRFVPNLRQKTLEEFCGLWDGRTDEISGRESISLYYDYLNSREEAVKDLILLHNRDDIVQLYRLTDVLLRADMHKAAFRYGFPVRKQTGPLLLVEKMELKNGWLTASGTVSGEGMYDAVRYGDEMPSWRFLDNAFTIQVPAIRHQGLLLADLADTDIAVDPMILASGYVVLAQEQQIQYEHCTLLIKAILERILEQWEM